MLWIGAAAIGILAAASILPASSPGRGYTVERVNAALVAAFACSMHVAVLMAVSFANDEYSLANRLLTASVLVTPTALIGGFLGSLIGWAARHQGPDPAARSRGAVSAVPPLPPGDRGRS